MDCLSLFSSSQHFHMLSKGGNCIVCHGVNISNRIMRLYQSIHRLDLLGEYSSYHFRRGRRANRREEFTLDPCAILSGFLTSL